MRKYESIGVAVPQVLLPKPGSDLTKWAVVACDQYTSQPAYWHKVEQIVGDSPSSLKLVYPEVYLGEANADARIARIRSTMDAYLRAGMFVEHEGIIYVERQTAGKTRRGLVLCVDLERYDYRKGSASLIRATEGTVVERLPPRIKIRQGAALELPHIMVLIDDPDDTVIGPIAASKPCHRKLYDFDLMMASGHLSGWLVQERDVEGRVVAALEALGNPEAFTKRYGLNSDEPVLLYAMGDGNHSLATAKAIWERNKEQAIDHDAIMNSAVRYALVELVNLHDEALVFEPIHRVVFDIATGHDLLGQMKEAFGSRLTVQPLASLDAMKASVLQSTATRQRIGLLHEAGYSVLELTRPDSNLPVGSLQAFLDAFMKDKKAREIDYVHGTSSVDDLGRTPGNMGFFLPAMNKHDLFKTVIVDGTLPRKTFSMGEAEEKRFYVECRRLS
ncbi:MAG: DUF1015 domain-containing protein [Polyangiaceae bacterium]|jgi:hypothetical protein|nr:DUF1015 domain-containing protein [Polyangiaceae bacterium]